MEKLLQLVQWNRERILTYQLGRKGRSGIVQRLEGTTYTLVIRKLNEE